MKMIRKAASILILAGACGTGVELETEDPAPATPGESVPGKPTLVALIELSETHSFEIYRDGSVLSYSETGSFADAPTGLLNDKALPLPVSIFQKLAPAAPVPEVLLDVSGLTAAPASTFRERTATGAPESRADGPLPTAGMRKPETEVVTSALTSSQAQGGNTPGTCPAGLFPGLSGPKGLFCPSSSNYDFVWCFLSSGHSWVDAALIRTRGTLGTVCTDAGELRYDIFITYLGSGNTYQQHTFFQPSGTWRQFRTAFECSWFTCDNLGIKFRAMGTNEQGNGHFGGFWDRWE